MFACNAINTFVRLSCCALALVGGLRAPALGQESRTQTGASNNASTSIRYVTTSEAQLYAGPGEEFYPTAIVKAGQTVEVQQETEEWLAITPPPGSFSWLPAAGGLLLPGGRIVEVTDKAAVSWIGTSLGTAKQYRWQTKLSPGQQLSVIGEQTIEDPASGSKALWYKITPPPGEVRWIQTKATSDQPPKRSSNSASERSSDSVPDSSQPLTDESIMESQVVQASGEQPLGSKAKTRATARTGPRKASNHQHNDPWEDWHALEFKNGSFSFPGFARMLGLPAAPTSNRVSSEDPFDLTAAYTQSRPKSAMPAGRGASSDTSNNSESFIEPSASLVHHPVQY